MSTHPRTGLPSSAAVDLAIAALARQDQYGAVTEIADEFEVTRQKVYEIRNYVRNLLSTALGEDAEIEGSLLSVTPQRLTRAIIALRVVAPASIRDIETLLPIMYDVHWSYGKIQSVLVEAGERAAKILSKVDLDAIKQIALDEMFSQGRPVFSGIDTVTQYLFQLELHDNRSGEEWENALAKIRDEQGLNPDAVVKDAGTGLAKGTTACWPSIESHDDLFHPLWAMGRIAYYLERRAYGAITREYESEEKRVKAKDSTERRRLGQEWRAAKANATEAIERYDAFEELRNEVKDILQLAPPGSGRLRTCEEVTSELQRIAAAMKLLKHSKIKKLARYLKKRAEGLGRYLEVLAQRLEDVTDAAGGRALAEAAVRLYQADLDFNTKSSSHTNEERAQELRSAIRSLCERGKGDPAKVLKAIKTVAKVLDQRHRASSAVENLHSVLRPHLVVQKNVEQSFLDLFRFWWNMRIRRWGRGKGTSAYEQLTGSFVADWLTFLGYPPDADATAAALN